MATRPTGTDEGEDVAGWIRDIGLGGLAENLIVFQGVLAFGLGVVFAFTFDTRGPRMRTVERDTEVIDEEVHDYRDEDGRRGGRDGRGASRSPVTVPYNPRARDERAVGARRYREEPWTPHRLTISTAGALLGSSGTSPPSTC